MITAKRECPTCGLIVTFEVTSMLYCCPKCNIIHKINPLKLTQWQKDHNFSLSGRRKER